MTSERRNEKSDGFFEQGWVTEEENRAGDWQFWWKEGKKALLLLLSGEVQSLFWCLLWPLVISEILSKFHSCGKWKIVSSWRSTRGKEDIFSPNYFVCVDLTYYSWWQTTSTIERKRWRQENVAPQRRKSAGNWGVFLRGFWQPVLLSVQTSTSALLTVPVTISVSTLPAASSATVIKATSSMVLHTVEVSQHPSTQHPCASLFNWQLLDRVCLEHFLILYKKTKVLKVPVV